MGFVKYILCLSFLLISTNSMANIGPKYSRSNVWKKSDTWKPIIKLIDEQKFKAAEKKTNELLKEFIDDKDEKNWTLALIMKKNLTQGLHKVETAVEELKAAKWPKSTSSKVLLSLYYAQSLKQYYNYYSWEINKREKIATKKKIDLKKWTKDQIFQEIQKTLVSIWNQREKLKNTKTAYFSEFISQGSYPREVRGTIRDAFTYFYVAFLEDTSLWSAKHSNETKLLNLDDLLNAKDKHNKPKNLKNKNIHPYLKIVSVLHDLERWHWKNDRISALLEARYEKYRVIRKKFSTDQNSKQILNHVKNFIKDYKVDPWWSEGIFLMATIKNGMGHPKSKIEARKLAISGHDEHPNSIGGQRCLALKKQIERNSIGLSLMNFDRQNQRSIEVKYTNWNHAYFRAYKYDPIPFILKQKNYSTTPNYNEFNENIIKGKKPDFTWDTELPDPKDYKEHTKFVNVPIDKKGFYIIHASANKDFSESKNYKSFAYFNVTDMHIVKTSENNEVKLQMFNALTGEALPEGEFKIYQMDWQKGHKFLKKMKANKDGVLLLNSKNLNKNKAHIYSATYKDNSFYNFDHLYVYNRYKQNSNNMSLVFTDRSVYRPKQKIHFKVLTFQNNQRLFKLPKALPNTNVTVYLRDANYETVQQVSLKTNEFASASGEFTIPDGRLLGNWSIYTSVGGNQSIKVEEYKRPTFLTELKDSVGEIKLNKKATFKGNAKYYFGLPVVDAKVKFKISRRASYPYWYRWWYGYNMNTSAQIVKTGVVKSDEKGNYELSFTPKAPKGESSNDIKYTYRVDVEVLNEGGETAKANKSFTIGKVAVQANINLDGEYLTTKDNIKVNITRTDLNGKKLNGVGEYTLYKLKNPTKTLEPSEQPLYYNLKNKPKKNEFQTKDDLKRSRSNGIYAEYSLLQSLSNDKKIINETLNHKTAGRADIDLGKLKSGAYRISYKTKDSSGGVFTIQKEFLVLAKKFDLNLPFIFKSNMSQAFIGDKVRYFIHTGYENQTVYFELYHFNKLIKKEILKPKDKTKIISYKVGKKDLGGLAARVYTIRDNTIINSQINTSIPFVSRNLAIDFSRIRKKVYPGVEESWKIKIKSKNSKDKEIKLSKKAEVLAYMYDKSLDVFASHYPGSVMNYLPSTSYYTHLDSPFNLRNFDSRSYGWNYYASGPSLYMDRIIILESYGIGGMGARGGSFGAIGSSLVEGMALEDSEMDAAMPMAAKSRSMPRKKSKNKRQAKKEVSMDEKKDSAPEEARERNESEQPKEQIRSNFSETAFFLPHLLTDKNGDVEISFKVPDSLTSWNVWASAVTKDLNFVNSNTTIESVKDLMVRTYIPRFFRQGDRIDLKVVINNAGKKDLSGKFFFELTDLDGKSLATNFELDKKYKKGIDLKLKAGGSQNYSVSLVVPYILGSVKLKAYAKTKQFTDGEEKTLPILPSRIHLAQSKFVTLTNKEKRTIEFKDMSVEDKTRINDSLVVKIDGQLFYSVLSALPYLVNYPYECTEQTLNRFVTTGILASTFKKFPSIAKMAKKMSKRKTQLESFDNADPNRKMALVETPWLQQSKGGSTENLLNMLDPKVVKNQKRSAIKKLKDSQTSSGGFPWFKGGPPSYYITTYILYGLSKAQEFDVEIPKAMTVKAWRYVAYEYKKSVEWCMSKDSCWEMITYINFVLSSFKDQSYTGNFFSKSERIKMLDFSFKHWKRHSPQLKGMLALLLHRFDRKKDAKLIFDSILDSSTTEKDLGTYWAPEDRSWLWYNDTIETHAYALRAMMELQPKNKIRHGLVKWLFLNKKLNHWKSTKATAEVMYSLLHYLQGENLLDSKEEISVKLGDIKKDFIFKPDEYTGKNNFVVVKGKEINEKTMNKIEVEQKTKGMSFASATWHYSTEKLPEEARGDIFNVTRKFFKREVKNNETQLVPLKDGAKIEIGDQVEVHLSIKAKHKSEYVHLMDPRPAGFEPDSFNSGYKWDLGLVRFQEIRDSGMNFFFEYLPVGEYTLKHRIRANLAGIFRTSPATLQSVYAPEFRAFSSGIYIEVKK